MSSGRLFDVTLDTEYAVKVQRVLEVARALGDAIDALDAPQPSITDSDDAEKRAWAKRNRANLEREWARDAPQEGKP